MAAGPDVDPRDLLSAAAVRERAHALLALAVADALPDWAVDLDRLADAADLTAEITRARFPDLDPPFHARRRHFVFDGRDLRAEVLDRGGFEDAAERARAELDLIVLSVLLDAGAGPGWSHLDEETGRTRARSEGLAVASLRLFASGALSGRRGEPLRADRLDRVDAALIARAFQVRDDNPLAGLEGRAALLRRLGGRIAERPDLFPGGRPGGLYDRFVARAAGGPLPAPEILKTLLEALGPVWAGRPSLGGVPLGDCWPHPQAGWVPLHKLSQWLTYSLVEPLTDAGLTVTDLDGLTGLAEYRNGGLFYDLGVLRLKDPEAAGRTWPVDSALVVGWRGLTVALLDRVAPLVRERLGLSAERFPLAKVLEGGTWTAGRELARRARPDGGPPLAVAGDGTVF